MIYSTARSRPSEHSDTNCFNHFKEFISQEGYPCVGAQAALHSRNIMFGRFDAMEEPATARKLGRYLLKYLEKASGSQADFLTFVAIFPDDEFESEYAFETALWTLLSNLHLVDRESYSWDPAVDKDPDSRHFSYSFGGKAFFIVGMHPGSSRRARRFRYPALAFNLHRQFDNLREKGRFSTMKRAIRQNEKEFDGSVNPMLNDFGKGLEAPQYSGRQVGQDWECPFKPMKSDESSDDTH